MDMGMSHQSGPQNRSQGGVIMVGPSMVPMTTREELEI